MLRSSYRLLGALLLIAIGVGCQRVDLDDSKNRPQVDYALQPINLILNFEQNGEPQPPQDAFIAPQQQSDENQSFYVTSTVDTKMVGGDDDVCHDFNIFLFHKTRDSIVRHYYISAYKPQIRLSNLYVGDYRLYIVVNNGPMCTHPSQWGCTHRHYNMDTLMSSIIPLPQKTTDRYYGLMVYSDPYFRILHENQVLEVKLKRLTSKISLNFTNYLPYGPGRQEYITLKDYSILNMPRRTKLFGNYLPSWQDVGQVTSYPISSTKFIVLNNLQGNGSAVGSTEAKDRNSFNAPQSASCVRLYATYYLSGVSRNVSYLIYLGGDGANNYDLISSKEYAYNIHLKRPDFTDLRVASFTVLNEEKKFESVNGGDAIFSVGEVISRPLIVEYSKLFANDSLFISCIQVWPDTKGFKYNVYQRVGDGYHTLYTGLKGESKTNIYVPTTKMPSGMDRAELKITYEQSVTGKAMLFLQLGTRNGQAYDLPQQTINYN